MADAPNDLPLLTRVASGDADAMRLLIDRYGSLVWSLALGFVRDEAEAGEAVSDVFSSLWERAGRYDAARGSELTFVALLARQRLIERWRQARRRPSGPLGDHEPSHEHADPMEKDEALAQVRLALAELPPEERRALRLSLAEGYSHSEIAEITATPLGTIKTMLRRALRHIHGRVQPVDPREEARRV